MKTAFTKLLRSMRKAGHPVLWAALFAALYGTAHYRDRLYWETPSIPFRPFCSPLNQFDPHRPFEGTYSLSSDFLDNVLHEFEIADITFRSLLYANTEQQKARGGSPILIAPKDFDDSGAMFHATYRALFRAREIPPNTSFEEAKEKYGVSLTCEDIEGKPIWF